MARRRDDDYEDDEGDDYDAPARTSGGAKGPLDNMFANTNIVVLILFACCCGLIAFILSLVAYLTAKDPKAKSNALIVMIVSGVLSVAGIIAQVVGGVAGAGFQGAR